MALGAGAGAGPGFELLRQAPIKVDERTDRPRQRDQAMLRNLLKTLRDERGMTLVELMVASMMTLGVLGAASYLMVIAVQTQPEISDQSFDIQQGRVFEERFTRELRA